jgi:NAD-dependent dihydropyrimidine dehydrogenase PreA subunit
LITFVEWAMPVKASIWQQREQYFHVTGGHDTRDKQLTQLQFPVGKRTGKAVQCGSCACNGQWRWNIALPGSGSGK